MKEHEVVDAIKKYLSSLQDVSGVGTEYTFIKNGCTSDVIGYSNNKIKYIVECKGSGNPGTIAGGIGQAYQYAHQRRFNQVVAEESEVYFACPEDRKNILDTMKIPREVKKILLIKENKDILIYKSSKKNNVENILRIDGTTYLEATTIKSIILIIEVLFNLKPNERNKNSFIKIMKNKDTNLKDYRNILITPRGLGLVENYSLTPKGYYFYGLLKRNEQEFRNELIKLLYPSLIVIINAFIVYIKESNQNLSKFRFTLKNIEKQIIKIYGTEVDFFNDRRLSYGVKILREIGVLEDFREDNKTYSRINKITNFT